MTDQPVKLKMRQLLMKASAPLLAASIISTLGIGGYITRHKNSCHSYPGYFSSYMLPSSLSSLSHHSIYVLIFVIISARLVFAFIFAFFSSSISLIFLDVVVIFNFLYIPQRRRHLQFSLYSSTSSSSSISLMFLNVVVVIIIIIITIVFLVFLPRLIQL
jgi:cytochrome bd-type quinol oxidase subunit 2